MGGVYGNAIAMALENCPVDARGLMSGILQQGYSLGYVIAACCNLGVGGGTYFVNHTIGISATAMWMKRDSTGVNALRSFDDARLTIALVLQR